VEGEGEVRLKDSVHEIPADHFFLIPAGTPHTYHSDVKQPWSIYWIHFAGSKASLFNRSACRAIPVERSKSSRISERIGLFSDIFRNLERGFSIETLEYVNQCLSYLLATFTHINQFREIRIAGEMDPVTRSINFMIENLDQKLMLDDLAAASGLSVSHYSNIFLARTGHSPIDYFIQLKVQQGCRLLDNSRLLVAEISRKSGYEDQFYFSRIFKKVMGMSPAEYRKRKS
jgi:AraC-like DNA-binding protein